MKKKVILSIYNLDIQNEFDVINNDTNSKLAYKELKNKDESSKNKQTLDVVILQKSLSPKRKNNTSAEESMKKNVFCCFPQIIK